MIEKLYIEIFSLHVTETLKMTDLSVFISTNYIARVNIWSQDSPWDLYLNELEVAVIIIHKNLWNTFGYKSLMQYELLN